MLQIIGKYQALPYWRLIPGGEPDSVVTEKIIGDFYALSSTDQIAKLQEYLYLHGYPVEITGYLDQKTQNALQQFRAKHDRPSTGGGVDVDTYLAVYTNIPVDLLTVQRRKTVEGLIQAYLDRPQKVALAKAKKPLVVSRKETRPAPSLKPGNLKLWTNKTEFNIGETLEINFEVDKPMFVRIITVNSNGEVATLFPNPHQSDNYCVPGIQYQIPPASARFSLDLGGPVGTDKIRAIAGTKPVIAESIKLTQAGEFDVARMDRDLIKTAVDITIR